MSAPVFRFAPARTLLMGTAMLLIAAGVSACASTKKPLTTGSISTSPSVTRSLDTLSATELAGASRDIGAAYEKNPKDRAIGLQYANVLRMTGRNDQALAVMQQVAINYPSDREVLAAYGKAQAAAGQFEQALQTISRAQTPDMPDWRLISAEGAILDQLGRSQDARDRYRKALDLKPNEPSVLSNSACPTSWPRT